MMLPLVMLLSGWGSAQAPSQAPRFFIEALEVTHKGSISTGIVIAESRLKPGLEYSERDLRTAINRIRRLPFVLEAGFTLKKGSRRGRYLLNIEVKALQGLVTELGYDAVGDENRHARDETLVLAGYRKFFGGYSQIYAAVFPDAGLRLRGDLRPQVNLGYSNYNLFGANIFLNLDLVVEAGDIEEDRFSRYDRGPVYVPTLNLSYYLGRNQRLKAGANYSHNESRYTYPGVDPPIPPSRERERSLLGSLSWEFDNTDDSWMPTRGWRLEARFSALRYEFREEGLTVENPGDFTLVTRGDVTGIHLDLARYRPAGYRHSLLSGVTLGLDDHEIRYEETRFAPEERFTSKGHFLTFRGGYRYQCFDSLTRYRWGDLFLGLNGTAVWRSAERNPAVSIPLRQDFWRFESEAFLAYRGKWGVARLGLRYRFGE